jgi:hypothetical protein
MYKPIGIEYITILLFTSILASCGHLKKLELTNEGNFWSQTEPVLTPGWISFKKSADIDPKSVFRDHARTFKLPEGNEMVIVSEEKDELEMTHYRYNQFETFARPQAQKRVK